MSGTSGGLRGGGGSAALPAPKVRLVGNDVGVQVDVPIYGASFGTLQSVQPRNTVQCVVTGVAQALLDNPQAGLLLELLRYAPKQARLGASVGSGFKEASYRHPSNSSGDGSHTHGGVQAGAAPAVQALRVSEWAVTQNGQVVDVTQAMHAYMQYTQVEYRDNANDKFTTPIVAPAGYRYAALYDRQRFGYGPNLTPGYFAFRLSIKDATDPRGQRVTGPMSHTVSLTNDVHPFRPDAPFLDGTRLLATVVLRPDYEPRHTRAWIGAPSRLPR